MLAHGLQGWSPKRCASYHLAIENVTSRHGPCLPGANTVAYSGPLRVLCFAGKEDRIFGQEIDGLFQFLFSTAGKDGFRKVIGGFEKLLVLFVYFRISNSQVGRPHNDRHAKPPGIPAAAR